MIDCSRDGYRKGRTTRALTFTGFSNVYDYRMKDDGRRMEKGECVNLGIPLDTCRCVITSSQMDRYLNPDTPIEEVPRGVSHYIEEAEDGRVFTKGRVVVLDIGPRKPSAEQKEEPESHPLDDGW